MSDNFLTSSDNNSTEDSSSDDNDDVEHALRPTRITDSTAAACSFDTNIPTTHQYMGELDRVSSYTIYEDGEVLHLLGIYTNTLVLPGFTLPLVLSHYAERTKMNSYLQNNNTFVLVSTNVTGEHLYRYAVTMEVFEVFVKDDILFLKAKGRQRCQIVDGEGDTFEGRLQQITVKIFAEPSITSPIANSQFLALKARRPFFTDTYENLKKNYKYRRYHLAQYPLASWVYDHHEVGFYVEHLYKRLLKYFPEGTIPKDPVTLSYWFIQNLMLTHQERLLLLSLDSTLERLAFECRLLKKNRYISCKLCLTIISSQNDIFVMSKDGVQSNYCNPDGHVYETLTVMKAENYTLHSTSSTKFSWFPGYTWTIMQCSVCGNHIGWQFTSKTLLPHKFFGLAKSCLEIAHDSEFLTEEKEDLE